MSINCQLSISKQTSMAVVVKFELCITTVLVVSTYIDVDKQAIGPQYTQHHRTCSVRVHVYVLVTGVMRTCICTSHWGYACTHTHTHTHTLTHTHTQTHTHMCTHTHTHTHTHSHTRTHTRAHTCTHVHTLTHTHTRTHTHTAVL